MVKILVASESGAQCEQVMVNLHGQSEISYVGTTSTGRETVEKLREVSIDAVIFSEDFADLGRAIRVSTDIPRNGLPSMVLAASELSRKVAASSIARGFDGAIALNDDIHTIARDLISVVRDGRRLANDPLVGSLKDIDGLLARELEATTALDLDVLDLVGVGLEDDAIADTLAISIQEVRNRIESLLDLNRLTSRTHLAIASASRIIIPDFF